MGTELEIDSNRSEEEQIKIAVMALYDEDKSELVEWAIEVTFAALIYVVTCLKVGSCRGNGINEGLLRVCFIPTLDSQERHRAARAHDVPNRGRVG